MNRGKVLIVEYDTNRLGLMLCEFVIRFDSTT